MDKEEYINRLLEDGFDFNDVVGKNLKFELVGVENEDGTWTLKTKASTGMTLNGVDWEEIEFKDLVVDNGFDEALATQMLSFMTDLNDIRKLADLRIKLNKTKALSEG